MAANYQAALHQLLKYDVGRSAYFDVSIPTPTRVTASDTNGILNVNREALSYLCHSAELPGESLATVAQKIYGVVEKFPIMAAYNDITLSFYTYGNTIDQVRKTFLTWIALITGRNEVFGGGVSNYNVAYKDDFMCNPVISHYSATGEKILECTLINAFPIAIAQVPLSWSAENHAISFNVTFAYTEYEYNMFNFTTGNITDASTLTTNFSELVSNGLKPKNTTDTSQNITDTSIKTVTDFLNNGLKPNPSSYQLTTTKF
jgi:hypothetical protein